MRVTASCPVLARVALGLTFLIFLASTPPATAATPSGLVGKLATGNASVGFACTPGLQWYQYFGAQPLSDETLTLDLALIPFGDGVTLLGLDEEAGDEFLGVVFEGGLANGSVPYNPGVWNDVSIEMQWATKDYTISVNGVTGGPFHLICSNGPCDSVSAFRLHSFNASGDTGGYVDSLTLTRTRTGVPFRTLFAASFDDGATYTLFPGTLIASLPPANAGGAGPGTSPGTPAEILDGINQDLSAPGLRGAVRSGVMEKVRAAVRATVTADTKAVRALQALIPALEAARGKTLPTSDADALIELIREALASVNGGVS